MVVPKTIFKNRSFEEYTNEIRYKNQRSNLDFEKLKEKLWKETIVKQRNNKRMLANMNVNLNLRSKIEALSKDNNKEAFHLYNGQRGSCDDKNLILYQSLKIVEQKDSSKRIKRHINNNISLKNKEQQKNELNSITNFDPDYEKQKEDFSKWVLLRKVNYYAMMKERMGYGFKCAHNLLSNYEVT